jgi:hypothetical protein
MTNMTKASPSAPPKQEVVKPPPLVSPKHVNGMVDWVIRIVQDIGECTIENIAASADKSKSWATKYSRIAYERGKLAKVRSRPIVYKIPGTTKKKMDLSMYDETGEKEHLSIYVDGSVCKKIEALATYYFNQRHGGQGQVIAGLVEKDFDRLIEEGVDFAELYHLMEEIDKIRGKG